MSEDAVKAQLERLYEAGREMERTYLAEIERLNTDLRACRDAYGNACRAYARLHGDGMTEADAETAIALLGSLR